MPTVRQWVTGVSAKAETVRSNPYSVISMPNPACPYDENDPDPADCICMPGLNLNPDPMFDEIHVIGHVITFQPCGHTASIGRSGGIYVAGHTGPVTWRMYQQDVPEPGTLGELMQAWFAAADTALA